MKKLTKLSKTQSQKLIKYYLDGANEDMKTVESLFDTKRYYAGLFFLHLVIEKVLKALVVQNAKMAPPFTHDLMLLSELAKIKISSRQKDLLRVMSQFNVRSRYDDYKKSFYKLATRDYALEYFNKGKKIFIWLKQFTQKAK